MSEFTTVGDLFFGLFLGFGAMVLLLIVSWWFYQLGRTFKSEADIEERYAVIEERTLCNLAKKKNIDIDKELARKKLFRPTKSIRRKMRNQVYEELFGKEKE